MVLQMNRSCSLVVVAGKVACSLTARLHTVHVCDALYGNARKKKHLFFFFFFTHKLNLIFHFFPHTVKSGHHPSTPPPASSLPLLPKHFQAFQVPSPLPFRAQADEPRTPGFAWLATGIAWQPAPSQALSISTPFSVP